MLTDNFKAMVHCTPAIIMFSTGKDSLVLLDLAVKYLSDFVVVNQYFYPCISYRDKFIAGIEKKYGITIHREPHPDVRALMRNNGIKVPLISFADDENRLRDKYQAPWVFYGYKKVDSIPRRGMLKHLPHGIDEQNHRCYPLAEWKEKEVYTYLKLNKIPLPIEYNYNFRDIGIYKDKALLWLYYNFRDDYENIKARYPMIEADLIRAREKYEKSN